MNKKGKPFRFRSFTSMMILWSFIIETISGIILYIVPPGRVANWTNWKLWGLTKENWEGVHTILGSVFLIFAIIHIYFNWKPIMSYIRQRIQKGLRMRKEMTISAVVTLLITVLTIVGTPPFGSIMDLGESLKNSWEESTNQPFIAYAELLTFREFTTQLEIPLEKALGILRERGIKVDDPGIQVAEIAEKNGIAPSQIYEFLRSALPEENKQKMDSMISEQSTGASRAASGLGWKTFEKVAEEWAVPIERIMSILKEEGIEAEKTDVIRDAAAKHDTKAYDLVNMLKEKLGIQ